MNRVEFDRRPTNVVMVTHRIPVPNRCDDVQRSLGRDIHSVFPSGIEVVVDDAGFGNSLLVLVRQDNVGITAAVHVACFQVFCLHDFDGKDIGSRLADLLELRRGILRDDIGASIHVDLMLESVQLGECILDVVQLDQRLSYPLSDLTTGSNIF